MQEDIHERAVSIALKAIRGLPRIGDRFSDETIMRSNLAADLGLEWEEILEAAGSAEVDANIDLGDEPGAQELDTFDKFVEIIERGLAA